MASKTGKRRRKKDKKKGVDARTSLLEPAWLPDGRYVCPKCMKRETLCIIDYGLAKNRSRGMFWFLVQCQECDVKFRVQKDV